MDVLLRTLAYLVIGLLLLLANIWFVRSAYHAAVGRDERVVGSFRISGKDDPGDKLGAALAQMLVAKVGRISQEMQGTSRALEAARATSGDTGIRPLVQEREVPLSIPGAFFQPLDVKLSVAGVEFGGILSWIQRAMVADRALSFSVQYTDDNKVIVTGQVPGGSPFYMENISPKYLEIVDAVAYTLVKDDLTRRFPELGTMDVIDFRVLVTTLQEAADLDKMAKFGDSSGERFKPLLVKLDGLITKMPRWNALAQIGAEMAENAREDAKALAYYRQLQAQTDDTSQYEQVLARKIAVLEARAKQRQVVPVPEKSMDVSAPPTLLDNPILAALFRDPRRTAIFQLADIRSLEMKNEVSIAVLGGVPSAQGGPEDWFKVIRPTQRVRSDPMMEEYLNTVVQWVRLVAPNAKFIFTPVKGTGGGGFEDKELLDSVKILLAARPDVFLVTLGPLESDSYANLFREAASNGTLVVIAAGNDGEKRRVPFAGSDLLDHVMVVSAVAPDGQPAVFTQRDEKGFWAPGIDIPVVLAGGKIEKRDGTSYAAAVAAGVGARVAAARKRSPEEIIGVLRKTAQPAASRGEPKVLQLNKALAL